MASSADLAGMASPTNLAGMTFLEVVGVTSPAELAGMALPAVAGASSMAVVEVASSTDLMECVFLAHRVTVAV